MKSALAVLLCAGALLLSTPAHADNTADEADVAFSLGNQAYGKREYDKALSWYFLSHRLVPNRNVLFNIARCFEALDKFDEAFRYYFELSGEKLAETIDFFGVMKMSRAHFVAFANNHSIHHRGQLAAYLRALGSKVPNIYGPSADAEPAVVS